MKGNTSCTQGATVQQRLTAQCTDILEEICSTIPQAAQADFETPVFSALALLQLDARKHCLHQYDMLRLLYLQGVSHGAAFGLECAASKMQQRKKPEAIQTKQTIRTLPERPHLSLSEAEAHA